MSSEVCEKQRHRTACAYAQSDQHFCLINGPRRDKICLRWFANNKGADQPAHLCSLINAFVVHLLLLDSIKILSKFATSEISIFYLVSLAEETGVKSQFVGNPKDRFSRDVARIISKLASNENSIF